MKLKIAVLSLLSLVFCTQETKRSGFTKAKQITSRDELITGPKAKGEIGDYLLANDKIRVLIQNKGFSRDAGFFGGSILDVDLIREKNQGYDNFAEIFPSFFLGIPKPEEITIIHSGSQNELSNEHDKNRATILISGSITDFLNSSSIMNSLVFNFSNLEFENEISISPSENFVTITTRLYNIGSTSIDIPLTSSYNGFELPAPLGDVLLFGEGNHLFAPGTTGFDTEFSIQEAYLREEIILPAIPGVVTDYIATSGNYVSYGLALKPNDNNYAAKFVDYYPDAHNGSLLIPFSSGGLTAVFSVQPPKRLEAGEYFEYTRYLMVGDGDAGSIATIYHHILNKETGSIRGSVTDTQNHNPVSHANVIIIDDNNDEIITHYITNDNGSFSGTLLPGKYRAVVHTDDRNPETTDSFIIKKNEESIVSFSMKPSATLSGNILDIDGNLMPGKVILVGTHDGDISKGKHSRDYLYNLHIFERFRPTDLIENDPDRPETLKYIEIARPSVDGTFSYDVKPGKYHLVVSHGIEYDIYEKDIELSAGKTIEFTASLKRAVDTTGYISGDFHVHAENSSDSSLSLADRVSTFVAEGVEYIAMTDHNFLTDIQPAIEKLGVEKWVKSMVGVEATTTEMGHFNGFPLKYENDSTNHGMFFWQTLSPDEIFERLRNGGKYSPDETIVQLNHPREYGMGYFTQFGFDSKTGTSSRGIFPWELLSLDFDAMEILNGKRYEQVHHFRVPENFEGKLPDFPLPKTGEILRDPDTKEVAFPGTLNDWFNMLNQGLQVIAVGNSDSHHLDKQEVGNPRTFFYTKNDSPNKVTDLDVVKALQSKRVFLSTGPIAEIFVKDNDQLQPMGSTVSLTRNSTITIKIRVQSASWVEPEFVNIFMNGENKKVFYISKKDEEFFFDVQSDSDFWVVAEVLGSKSLFPVVPPDEIPIILWDSVTRSLGGRLVKKLDKYKDLRPKKDITVIPYALTNPIWVIVDGDGKFSPLNPQPLKKSQKSSSQMSGLSIDETFYRFEN